MALTDIGNEEAEMGMSPADVMALANNDGFGGNNGLMMLFLFALIFGWNGNGFNNSIGYENLATSNEVQRGFDNQNSLANEREILSAVNSGTAQAIQADTQNTQYLSGQLADKYSELQRDVAGLALGQGTILANQNECLGELRFAA